MTVSRLLWVAVVFLGGMCMATQSRINGELASRISDGFLAALISFGSGLTILAVIAVVTPFGRAGTRSLLRVLRSGELRWWYALTGLIGAYFVASQGLAVPTLGVALFTVCVVAGQAVSGMVVDRIGIGILAAKPITLMRVVGAVVTLGAVSLGMGSAGEYSSAIWLMLLAFGCGMTQAVQYAFGGQVQFHAKSALAQSLSNFVVGTVALAVIVGVRLAAGVRPQALPTEPWLYVGGALGCVFVAITAVAVQRIGVLQLSLAAVAGQVSGSIVLDATFPTGGHPLTALAIAGAMLAIVGVALSAVRFSPSRA